MAKAGDEDPRLEEVKAILARLQRLSADQSRIEPLVAGLQTADAPPESAISPSLPLAPPVGQRVHIERPTANAALAMTAAPTFLPGGRRRSIAVLAIVVTLSAAASAAVLLDPRGPIERWLTRAPSAASQPDILRGAVPAAMPEPPRQVGLSAAPAPPSPPRDPRAVIDMARDHLTAGRVAAARTSLLSLSATELPDAAWLLARSYDPGVLLSLPARDGEPDIEAASRWYRAWHDAAVRQGQITDSIRLDRIIESLGRSQPPR
jgi:hypothetical protein